MHVFWDDCQKMVFVSILSLPLNREWFIILLNWGIVLEKLWKKIASLVNWKISACFFFSFWHDEMVQYTGTNCFLKEINNWRIGLSMATKYVSPDANSFKPQFLAARSLTLCIRKTIILLNLLLKHLQLTTDGDAVLRESRIWA